MADEHPPSTPENPEQTVSNNLSSNPDAGTSDKSQTVRISLPPAESIPGSLPKKETTQFKTALPTGPKPILPPIPGSKPMVPGAPKPPVLGVKPSLPTAPGAPTAPVSAAPVSPKKETARILIPPQPKTPLHKATVKLEQPKPATMATAAAIVSSASPESVVVEDSSVAILSWVVVAASVVALAISFVAFNSANL